MRSLIISNVSKGCFEGNKNVALHLEKYLSQKGDLLHLNLKRETLKNIFRIKKLNPSYIHIVFRLSKKLIIYFILLRLIFRKTKLIFWSLQPPLIENIPKYKKKFYPHKVLVLTPKTKKIFSGARWPSNVIMLGINKDKFVFNRFADESEHIRQKFNVPKNKSWILHVGPIKWNRNVSLFLKLANLDRHITIISRPDLDNTEDVALKKILLNADIQIIDYYIDDIERIYHAIDLYVFPTFNTSGCIETPLSVLETLSCGKIVVARDFGSLNTLSVPNLILADNDDTLVEKVESVLNNTIQTPPLNCQTFDRIISWKQAFQFNEKFYENI